MPNTKIFNGGLNAATAPHLIQANQAEVYENIDHIPGSLTPSFNKVSRVSNAKKFSYNFLGTWYFEDTPKDWVTFQEVLYVGNRTGESTYLDSLGVAQKLGIAAPTVQPTLTIVDAPVEITRLKLTNITTGGNFEGNTSIKYRIINYNLAGRASAIEFEPFLIAVPSGTSTNKVELDIDRDVNLGTTAEAYRFLDGSWYKVGDIPDSTTTLTDNLEDISANPKIEDAAGSGPNGVISYALTFYNSLTGDESVPLITPDITCINAQVTISNMEVSTDPQVTHKRLYRIGGSNTIYTRVVELTNATTSYIDVLDDDNLEGSLLSSETNFPAPQNLMYLTEAYAMFFAADGDKLRFTPIGKPAAWPETFFLDFPATITGIAKTPIGLLIFDTFTTYLVTGTGPLSLAQQLLTGDQGCVSHDSIVNVQGAAYWASTDGMCVSDGGQVNVWTRQLMGKLNLLNKVVNAVVHDQIYYLHQTDDTTLVVDVQRNIVKTMLYGIKSLNKSLDVLYGFSGSALYELESDIKKLSMSYTGPWNIGFGLSIQKVYKNIYVYSTGDITVSIYVNGTLAQTVVLIDTDNHQIKLPTEYTRGFYIQFQFTGTGTVYELSWEEGNANV